MLWRYEVYFLCLSLYLFHLYFLRSVTSEVQNRNALQISERPKEKATQAPSVFKSGSISENVMLLNQCATPRVCLLCRMNSCNHCPSLVTADGLTWTWIAPCKCLACYWSCSNPQDVLLGWPVMSHCSLCRTELNTGESFVLPVMWWAIASPQPMSLDVCGEWWDRRGCFQLKWFELLLSPLVWLADLSFQQFGGRIWHILRSWTQVSFVRKQSLQKLWLTSRTPLVVLLQKSLTGCFLHLLWQQTLICYCLL